MTYLRFFNMSKPGTMWWDVKVDMIQSGMGMFCMKIVKYTDIVAWEPGVSAELMMFHLVWQIGQTSLPFKLFLPVLDPVRPITTIYLIQWVTVEHYRSKFEILKKLWSNCQINQCWQQYYAIALSVSSLKCFQKHILLDCLASVCDQVTIFILHLT